MTAPLKITVLGRAATQGSKVAIRNRAGAIVGSREASKFTAPWRQDVRALMLQHAGGYGRTSPFNESVTVTLALKVPRPRAHYRSNGVDLKPGIPEFPPNGLDLDKVARCVGDAMKGIWLKDDARISEWRITRDYCEPGEVERTIIECRVRVNE